MIAADTRSKILLSLCLVAVGVCAPASGAQAAAPPVKQIEAFHLGWEVNTTTKGEVCTVQETCQPGTPSGRPGGFKSPQSVAAAGNGSSDVYVADDGNNRIQELEADGKFVLMFGKDVNKKGGDVCTAAEASECQAGQESTEPGSFHEIRSIAVDPTSGNVFATDGAYRQRVQEFEPTGAFVLEIGRGVNETKTAAVKAKGGTPTQTEIEEENLCTAEETKSGGKCTVPAASSASEPEPGAFNFTGESSSFVAVGGPEDLLYVGDEHRVQEFDAKTGPTDGHYVRELGLTSLSTQSIARVHKLALDQATGHLYVVYGGDANEYVRSENEVIHEFDTAGKELAQIVTTNGVVQALAVDPEGRLAVSESEGNGSPGSPVKTHGSLYETSPSPHVISGFASHGTTDMAFNSQDKLFAVFGEKYELTVFEPVPVGELLVGQPTCVPGSERETDVTLDCALAGEVDPWGVAETEVWFRWGGSETFGSETPKQPIVTGSMLVGVGAQADGVLPDEKLYVELAGEDRNVKAPEEAATSTVEALRTPAVAPRIVGAPLASFARPTSVVMLGTVNPENTLTEYEFQYAPEAGCDQGLLEAGQTLPQACAGTLQTSALQSLEYGQVAVAQEVGALQPATVYRYRLYAKNAQGQGAVGESGGSRVPEGTFETAPAPLVSAITEGASAVTPTSAVVSGSVNPDGVGSVYTFELGVYTGTGTRYGTVFSASAGSEAVLEQESLQLTGLQPGTTYAYRITVHFGDGSTPGSAATGETRLFTTQGVPAVLVSPAPLAQLSIPSTVFPKPVVVGKTKKPKKKTKPKKKGRAKKAAHAKRGTGAASTNVHKHKHR